MPPCWTRESITVPFGPCIAFLGEAGEIRERRDQARHPKYKAPELLATAPNQVWSWDITKLLGPVKWTYFYLYVILDIFSRYVVGWMIAPNESSALAKRLIAETCEKAKRAARATNDSCRPWVFDEIQTCGTAAGGSRYHEEPQPPACFG